jgi:rod shape determining protein RodA
MWRHFDVLLLAATSILTIAGVAMIRSAIGGNVNLAENVQRQAIFAAIGLVIAFITASIDYRLWAALARPIYIFTLVSLAFIAIAGQVAFGAARWFTVGTLFIQPSELAKILMILVLAEYLARNKEHVHKPRTLFRSLLIMGLPILLIFIQPDLSTGIVLGVIWMALVWAAGTPLKTLLGILAVVVLVTIVIAPVLADYFVNDYPEQRDFFIFDRIRLLRYYQMDRIANFLFPDPDAAYGSTYNVNQAKISIGSGGLLGKGYAHGSQVQLRFLKVRHTDFIFSAMAEEFGFVGALILVMLLMFIIYRALLAAQKARDTFGALICYGVAFLLLFQGAFNIGMNLNLFPVSGLPLPFFSYGGSSLLTSLIGIGLVESVILRHKPIEL